MPYKDKDKEREWIKKNKERRKVYQAKWHQENKERRLNKLYEDRQKRAEEFEEYKKTLKCSKCGFSHPAALDFHHKNDTKKDYNISEQIRYKSFDDIKKEVEKCVVLCANCHRILRYDIRKNGAEAKVVEAQPCQG